MRYAVPALTLTTPNPSYTRRGIDWHIFMKYRPEQYAQALLAACHEKSDVEQKKIVKRFVQLLARHQATSKTHAICAAYEKLELRNKGMRSVRLETASLASEKLKNEIHRVLGKNIHIKEVVNPDLLGGLKILIDDEILIDASARRQMEELFIKKPPSTR